MIIDLHAERRRRQADRADFDTRCMEEARAQIAFIEAEAERGFAAAGPIADREIRRVIHGAILRRIRAKIRKSARERQTDAETIIRLVETAERIYENRLIDLMNQRRLSATKVVP